MSPAPNGLPVPYPALEPYRTGRLDVDGGHSLYYEECGNPGGLPVLFLHSGPGGGCTENSRRLFDPARYRIVLFDQRGCGRSRPLASLLANTTAHLLSDIEALRRSLGVERFVLLGGSWGATLALAYAQRHPDRTSGLILRGVFTARCSETDWLYRAGASELFPEAWQRFLAPIPEADRGDLVRAYHSRLASGDAPVERAAAEAWCAWEEELLRLVSRPNPDPGPEDAAQRLALARIEAHYLVNAAFLEEGQLLRDAHRLRGIPGVIVQGRYDPVTPARTAWELHRAWPGSVLRIVEDAGHASSEPGMLAELLAATDAFASGWEPRQQEAAP